MAQKKDEKKRTWYYYGSYRDAFGKVRQYKKRGYATRREARIAEEEFRKKIHRPKAEITFAELVDLKKEDSSRVIKASTYDMREAMYKNFDVFNSMTVSEITKSQCKQFMKDMHEKHSDAYYQVLHVHLKSIFQFAVDEEYIERNPMAGVRVEKNKEKKKEMQFWEPQEFERFIKYVDIEDLRVLFIVLYYMGTRKGEALGLLWCDIDFENKTMDINKTFSKGRLTTPKTRNSYRVITMPDVVYEALYIMKNRREKELGYQKGERIFQNIIYSTLNEKLIKYIKRANKDGEQLKVIRIHDFRHSHASYLINNMNSGFTDFDVAKRLGDTVNTLHMVYAHWFKQKDNNIINFINADTKKV